MKKLYEYLFYRIYVEWKKQGKNDIAMSAMFALSFLIGTNLIFIYLYINTIFGEINLNETFLVIIMYLSIFAINSYLFLYKGEYKKIEERFKNETKREKRLSSIAILSLVGITFGQIVFMVIQKNFS
jgi:hypothetical protein